MIFGNFDLFVRFCLVKLLTVSTSVMKFRCILRCRRPTTLQDRTRDSDDDDYQDRDYDVAALANNLSQAFQYGIYSNDATNEVCFDLLLNALGLA